MNKQYETPTCDIVTFSQHDCIRTSSDPNASNDTQWSFKDYFNTGGNKQ
ncbi:MAG: hypothetical protein IJX88_06305 [Clostridia bacterium]|nr:hypothetical protein [Clostridia bacterium]